MDSLSAEGVRLTRYYTNHLCTPSRVSFGSGCGVWMCQSIDPKLRISSAFRKCVSITSRLSYHRRSFSNFSTNEHTASIPRENSQLRVRYPTDEHRQQYTDTNYSTQAHTTRYTN
ncbi:unnamed protein product, partial [Laminaria digitata]